MNPESLRSFCLSLPNVTEDIQWGDNLLLRIGGKIFAILVLDPGSKTRLSLKCSADRYFELLERDGIISAPYLGRFHWVALTSFKALEEEELKDLLKRAYDLIEAKLPRKKKKEQSPDKKSRMT